MSYIHKGKILSNGVVDTEIIQKDSPELKIKPEDDGLHILDFTIGDFEWWYFDILDNDSGYFIKIVFHIGTDPLKRRIFPQLAVSLNTPHINQNFVKEYKLSEVKADNKQCDIRVKDEIQIRVKNKPNPEYYLKINIHQFKCEFTFYSNIEGWKPLGNSVQHNLGKKSGAFSWIIPQPRAHVKGEFIYDDDLFMISSATGYHDHNYNKVNKVNPLHLDELVTHWYWGKCYINEYTIIFMDTWCRTNRTNSVLVAKNDKIVYSANNHIELNIEVEEYDKSLKVHLPKILTIKSLDKLYPFKLRLKKDRILDSKDLIDTIPALLKRIIKTFVARPAYHGVFSHANLKIENKEMDGIGNYEAMVFRKK